MKNLERMMIERWNEQEWMEKATDLLGGWLRGEQLIDKLYLPRCQDRWDLRGLDLNNPTLRQKVGRFQKNVIIENVSFSETDFSFSNWENLSLRNCIFNNVFFSRANLSGLNDRACTFLDVDFTYANRLCSTLGINRARYERVNFQHANLSHSYCDNGYLIDCDFSHAKVQNIDFDATHLTRCKFAGKLKSVWFRGYYKIQAHEDRYGKTEPNPMEDIDFSAAEFWDVEFTTNCDLSRVVPPADGKHILIKNWPMAREMARNIIQEEWSGFFQDRGLHYLKLEKDNPMTIYSIGFYESLIRKYFPASEMVDDFIEQYFSLLWKVTEITNGQEVQG
jgi:uncharacterized protein YjbI with pentapeptide repeats